MTWLGSFKENKVLSTSIYIKIWLQATFVTKISLVALDKSHETLVANDKGYWMKEKVNKYKFIL
jgi:hypothetical protein